MANHLKLLSLAAALCGALACSSSDNGTTSGTGGGPGTTGTTTGKAANGTSGASATGGSPTATGGSPTATGGNGTGTGTGGNNTTGGGTTGASGPTTYPCVDGGAAYQPTNPPNGLSSCWCNPTSASGPLAYYQIINGCPPSGSTPNLTISLPPPVGTENITGLAAANLPLFVDAGIPGFVSNQ